MPPLSNLIGRAFGRLTVLDRAEPDAKGRPRWQCQCSCGVVVLVAQYQLRRGYDGCAECRKRDNPCVVCGHPAPLKRYTCSEECAQEKGRRDAHAHYLRNKDKVIARSAERAKRRRAEGDPVFTEQDRRKWQRIKNDPEKYAATLEKGREWYAEHHEEVAAKRAARLPPKEPRVCERCGIVFVPRARNCRVCSMACRHTPLVPAERPCVQCGTVFMPRRGNQCYCSDACRTTAHAERWAEIRREEAADLAVQKMAQLGEVLAGRLETAGDRRISCKQCRQPFLPDGRRQRLCSPECRATWKAVSTAVRPCIVCGKEFAGTKRTDKTCSLECLAERKRRRVRARLNGEASLGNVERTCVVCGMLFRGHKAARYCTNPECIRAAAAERSRERVNRDYHCRICGKDMSDLDLKTHRYTCSAACRREATRRRQRRVYEGRKHREQGKTNR